MNILSITESDAQWNAVKEYAGKCAWRAGASLASKMDRREFSDWERVIVALDHGNICGFCTTAKTDCIPGVAYTPYIGYVFVDEAYRGNRLSEKMIRHAMRHLKSNGFHQAYLVSDHVNLYEKYGFRVIDRKMAPWGTEEKIYMQELG